MIFRLINLYNKNSIKIDSDNINNYRDIIQKYHKGQEIDKLYLYNFTKYDKYLSLYDNNKKLTIHKIDEPLFIIFLLKFYGIKRTKHQIKNSIIKNSETIFDYANKNYPKIFNRTTSNNTKFDNNFKNKLYNNLTKLQEKCKDRKTCANVEKYLNYINKKGGYEQNYDNRQVYDDNRQFYNNEQYKENEDENNEDKSLISKIWGWIKWFIGLYIFPIYTIEQAVYKYLPGWPSTILYWSLELIDFLLTLASALLPVAATVATPAGTFVAGLILDSINLVYNIARFDVIGIIVSLIGYISYLGDALSIGLGVLKPFIKIGAKKLFKIIGKFFKTSVKSNKNLSKLRKTASRFIKNPATDEAISYIKGEAENLAYEQAEKYGEQLKDSIYDDEQYYYEPEYNTQYYE